MALVGSLLLPDVSAQAEPVAAPAGASQHVLTLDPAQLHWAAAGFSNAELADDQCVPDFPDSTFEVGFTPFVDVSILFPDRFTNCVYQTAASFDMSPLRQFPGTVITNAAVRYDEQIIKLRDPDGYEPVDGTPDVFPGAVVGTCLGRIGIPSQDWSEGRGLIPNESDDTLQRFAGPVWDVTNQASHWYLYPDEPNLGLLFAGYDEGGDFSNMAECVSVINHIQLIVELVSSDPTPTPTPNLAQRAESNANAAMPPTSTPASFHRLGGVVSLVPTQTPAVNPGAVLKALPDLVVTAVDIAGSQPAPHCGVMTFTAHIKNLVSAASPEPVVVALSVDGTGHGSGTVGALAGGAEATVSFSSVALSHGTHAFTVTVNGNQKVFESDFSNDTYSPGQPGLHLNTQATLATPTDDDQVLLTLTAAKVRQDDHVL